MESPLYPCPLCGGPGTKAMYMGIPVKLCGDTLECCGCWGACSWLLLWVPFNGWFIRYDNYWSALWEFLTGQTEDKAR